MNEVVLGNVYDKYSSRNPLARRLFSNFLGSAQRLVSSVEARYVLEAGCGEGHFSRLVTQWRPGARVVGVDLSDSIFDCEARRTPRLRFSAQSIYEMAFPEGSFDLVLAIEVLEHLEKPETALAEIHRVARDWVVLSVPREPIWRLLNVSRLAYLRDFGNTPGHFQHWSSSSFLKFVSRYFSPVRVEKPLPWTMVLARKKEC